MFAMKSTVEHWKREARILRRTCEEFARRLIHTEKLLQIERQHSKNLVELVGEQFTQDELKSLRRMIHPDRNGGSQTATQLTQKLNQLIK